MSMTISKYMFEIRYLAGRGFKTMAFARVDIYSESINRAWSAGFGVLEGFAGEFETIQDV